MKFSDLKDGMTVKAVGDWADCWKDGETFVVKTDNGEGHEPIFYVECHETGHHGLDAMDNGDGDLPEFEPA